MNLNTSLRIIIIIQVPIHKYDNNNISHRLRMINSHFCTIIYIRVCSLLINYYIKQASVCSHISANFSRGIFAMSFLKALTFKTSRIPAWKYNSSSIARRACMLQLGREKGGRGAWRI